MINPSDFLPRRGTESIANLFHVVRRRIWSVPGRAHIEIPDLEGEEYRDFTQTLSDELEAIDGVVWAAANGALHRMVVTWEVERTDLEAILEVADSVEERFNLQDGPYSDEVADHPGDDEPIVRGLARMASDLVGTALGVTMKVTRQKPGRRRFDMAALMAIVDNVPHIRQSLERRMGKASADMSIGLGNPVIQGLGSGPGGPILDFAFQLGRFMEAVERRRSWTAFEPELCNHPERVAAPQPSRKPRPIELPDGPIEEYAENVWNMSLGGFFVGLADTQDLKRAVTPLLDALPKPARYGRDAFSARLTKELGKQGLLVLDPEALRRIDRVDCVIVDEDLLVTDRWDLDRVAFAEDSDAIELYERAEELLDPVHPESHQSNGIWELRPASQIEVDETWIAELKEAGARGDFLALRRDEKVCALFSLRSVTDPTSELFIEAVRDAELELIIVTDEEESVEHFRPDRTVATEGVDRFIRHIQRDYQVVAYFGEGPCPALDAADCGVGFRRNDVVPWNADIVAADELQQAIFFVDAIAEARNVSKTCAILAGAGAGIGALSAIRGLEKTRPGRVMVAVNFASLVALGYGAFRAGRVVDTQHMPSKRKRPWYRLRIGDVLERLETSREGLSEEAAKEREQIREEPPSRAHRIARSIGRELSNPLTPVLAGGAAVSAMVGSVADAAIVGTVIAFNGLVGGIERFKAEEVIDEMARREAIEVTTRRDGRWKEIAEDCLVTGDIVRLEAGDVVPADCRIIEARHLEVDESSLTGESLPIAKDPDPNFSHLPAERSSMLYDGTAVVAGEVTAVVVAIGPDTEAQRSRWIGGKRDRSDEGVEGRLQKFSDLTIPFAGFSGGVLMSLGVFRRHELKELVGPAVNLAVGAVPEGLPLLATAAQLAASRRLSERNIIVHNPRAMEAIGRADTLCIDKTGTLTSGTLQVHSLCNGGADIRIDDAQWQSSHEELFRVALRATPTNGEEKLPHATDQAVVDGAGVVGLDVGDWTPVATIPFKTTLSFSAALGRVDDELYLAVKGSPEKVLECCSRRMADGGAVELDGEDRRELLERAHRLAGRGLRILAVARRDVSGDGESLVPDDVKELTFLGFVTLSDPLRPTAIDAVASLEAAGVSLLMLTGDHPETARRIALEAGIDVSGHVLTGDRIEDMSDEQLAELLPSTTVIARMTPAQKVRIVEALQRAGRLVAMTGDGGNDAAAIRLADAGIALGADSSSAARDAADLVVTDARIESIVDAVIEGRAMWRSVRDAVSILIGGNMGEVGFMLASGLVETIPALNARQLLLVNLFTDVAPALAIALRPPPDISPDQLLYEGPEESLGAPMEKDIMWRAGVTASAAFAAWFVARHTFQRKRASTVGLLAVVAAQLGQTLTAARPTLPVWAASLGSAAVLLAIIETPGLSHLLGCRPLGPVGLTTAFGSAAVASAASVVIPRIPQWKKDLVAHLPSIEEPEMDEFIDEFYEAYESGIAAMRP